MTILSLLSAETFTSFLVKINTMSKTSYLYVVMLYFECPVCQPNFTVQPYFQPNFVVSAKIWLIRISAKKSVQPAEFLKNPADGSGAGSNRRRHSGSDFR